jgi:hypothetical protein
MLIIDGVKYSLYVPKDEKEFEGLVKEHFSEIFGKDSLYFDIKPELRSEAGIGSKPDAIVICLGEPSVYVIEYELKGHPIHDHVVAQISKFNKAFKSSETKLKLAGAVHSEVSSDLLRKALTESKVKGELFKFFTDLFSSKPKVVIIVDEATEELKEAVEDLPFESKIVEFKTFERDGVGVSVHAHLFEPLYPLIQGKIPYEEKKVELKEHRKARVELWCRIYNEGGIVTRKRLREIWTKVTGKDAKGLGGFFTGKNPSLARTLEDKITLTKIAEEKIKAWTGKTIDDYAKHFKEKAN